MYKGAHNKLQQLHNCQQAMLQTLEGYSCTADPSKHRLPPRMHKQTWIHTLKQVADTMFATDVDGCGTLLMTPVGTELHRLMPLCSTCPQATCI
jgi:hypothetical protein